MGDTDGENEVSSSSLLLKVFNGSVWIYNCFVQVYSVFLNIVFLVFFKVGDLKNNGNLAMM